jgi:hypothetical protein
VSPTEDDPPTAVARAIGLVEEAGHRCGIDSPRLQGFGSESRLVVSEPLGDLPGVWNEVPEAS